MLNADVREGGPMPQVPQQVIPPPTARPVSARRGLALDLFRGIVWGDFDRQLGVAGATAQSAIGFIPVVGTIAALRDLLACIGQGDPLGIFLNLLAIFPVFGGLAKTADAVHALHHYHRASQRRKYGAMDGTAYQPYYQAYPAPAPAPVPHRSGWASLGLSLLLACGAALYGTGVRTVLEFLRVQGPTIQGYPLHGDGAWLAPLILLPLGLLVGLVVTVGNRLWLGLVLLPVALSLGFTVSLTGWW
jgi:hypothetical protein